MRSLVVYESMFGNTEAIARAVAAGLARRGHVDAVEVRTAPRTVGGDVDLLVVGGPTHAFGMSRPRTRQSAADQAEGPLVPAESGSASGWRDRRHLGRLRRRRSTPASPGPGYRVLQLVAPQGG